MTIKNPAYSLRKHAGWLSSFLFRSVDNAYPAIYIRFVAILDSPQFVVQLFADRSRLAIFGDDVGFVFVQVVDLGNRGNDSCGSAFGCLVEGSNLFIRDRTAFDGQSHVGCQLLQALVRDRGQDGVGLRRDVAVSADTEESSCFFTLSGVFL